MILLIGQNKNLRYLHDDIGQKETKALANGNQFSQPVEEAEGVSLMSQQGSEEDADFQGTWRQS
jgi:hypothetical protein